MDAVQRYHHFFARRHDLVSVALEFRLGHWNSRWIDTLDDGHDAVDVCAYSTKTRQTGDEIAHEVQI